LNAVIRLLALLLCTCVILMGCSRTTTVILPPETTAHAPCTTAGPTEPSGTTETEPGVPEASPPTQLPTTEPATESPTTIPTESPTEIPTVEATVESENTTATEPSAAPTTIPATEPATEPPTDSDPVYDIDSHTVGSLEYSLLDAINSNRADASLAPLSMSSKLCALAAIRAYECSESFSQVRPDGRSAYSVLTDYGYAVWSNFSQRIHYGSAGLSANSIVKGWMYTDAFSANILSGDFTHLGIGVYTTGGTTYIVCFFAG